MGENGASLSDIAALVKNGDGLGGGAWWVIILFAMIYGWGNGGLGGSAAANAIGYENLATSSEVQRGFDSQSSMANQREILAAVNSGTSQAVAATNQTFHDGVMALSDKYSELQRDIANVALQASQNRSGQQECCCNVLRAIDGVNYNGAQNTSQVIAAVKDEGAQTRAMIQQDKVERLQERVTRQDATISELRQNAYVASQLAPIAQGVAATTKYPNPNAFSYSAGPNPFCGCGCATV